MAETYSGEFYCVKCKEKRQAEGKVVETQRPPHGQGQVPGVRHEPQPHPRQGLSHRHQHHAAKAARPRRAGPSLSPPALRARRPSPSARPPALGAVDACGCGRARGCGRPPTPRRRLARFARRGRRAPPGEGRARCTCRSSRACRRLAGPGRGPVRAGAGRGAVVEGLTAADRGLVERLDGGRGRRPRSPRTALRASAPGDCSLCCGRRRPAIGRRAGACSPCRSPDAPAPRPGRRGVGRGAPAATATAGNCSRRGGPASRSRGDRSRAGTRSPTTARRNAVTAAGVGERARPRRPRPAAPPWPVAARVGVRRPGRRRVAGAPTSSSSYGSPRPTGRRPAPGAPRGAAPSVVVRERGAARRAARPARARPLPALPRPAPGRPDPAWPRVLASCPGAGRRGCRRRRASSLLGGLARGAAGAGALDGSPDGRRARGRPARLAAPPSRSSCRTGWSRAGHGRSTRRAAAAGR